ncbi:hypothetical protein [Adhaeretor mobilis]|uniref:Uncharacterized protein n=1 Tax=Adhaeretor mobilis TaxID=1930276 RepID=A0A517N1R1_9BACT|nr:hypothetical protein [Adhaeretor mobilis]QDT01071.1 hypothetical protein HG15A2_44130 [Adhaeretor mobilis]
MDRWDILLICFAGYVAVTTLVKLMAARRNELVEQVRMQVEQQKKQLAKQQVQAEDKQESEAA